MARRGQPYAFGGFSFGGRFGVWDDGIVQKQHIGSVVRLETEEDATRTASPKGSARPPASMAVIVICCDRFGLFISSGRGFVFILRFVDILDTMA